MVSVQKRNGVYLVVIGWMYVVLMMTAAEASSPSGTVLGAIVTFLLYGLGPVALVVFIMGTPHRRRQIKAREAAEDLAQQEDGEKQGNSPEAVTSSHAPDAGSHAARAPEAGRIATVREED